MRVRGIIATDVRHALRRWRRRPGLALTATLVLAIGIGATTAMASMVHAVLLQDEPWPDADRLVRIYGVLPGQRTNPAYTTRWNRVPISWPSWRDLRRSASFADVAVWVPDQRIVGDDSTELVRAYFASSTLPLLVGARPALGRFFTDAEDEADSGTVILSHRLWTRLFGADPGVIGRITTVTPPGGAAGEPTSRRTIVGVLPQEFKLPGETPDVLIPLGFHTYNGSSGNPFLLAMARLAPGTSVSAAAAAAEPLVRREETADRRTSRVVTVRTDRVGMGDWSLWAMLTGAALMLAVACSNVAGLLQNAARSRRHETAVRLALGAARGAIVRQLAVEHALLATAAAAAGLLLAAWLLPILTALAPPGLIGDQRIALDLPLAAGAIVAAAVITLLAGFIPLTATSTTKPCDALKAGGRDVIGGSPWRHRVVVAAQFGLATVLLVGAGLFGETFARLGREPLGFDPVGVAVVSVAPARQSPRAFSTPAERAMIDLLKRTDRNALNALLDGREWVPIQALMDRLSALPAVRAVAVTDAVPFAPGLPRLLRVGRQGGAEDEAQSASMFSVSADYFDVMSVQLLDGRTLRPADVRGRMASRVTGAGPLSTPVVISESLARRVFDADAVGKILVAGQSPMEVVGVVGDLKQRGPLDNNGVAVYFAAASAASVRHIVVRTSGGVAELLPALRSTVEGNDTPMFVTSTAALSSLVRSTTAVERGRAMLSAMYGGVSLLLASIGLYGLTARLVVDRRHEIGIRIALGAGPRDVRRLVLTDTWLIVAGGLLVGLPLAVLASWLMRSLFYGVAPAALQVIGLAVTSLSVSAIAATVLPARRASRVDPVQVLKEAQ
jgi:ABC-type antimicrobial peptide transport system permease subunit